MNLMIFMGFYINMCWDCYGPRLHRKDVVAVMLTHHRKEEASRMIAVLAFIATVVEVSTGYIDSPRANRNLLVPNQAHKLSRLAYGADCFVINAPAREVENREDLFVMLYKSFQATGHPVLLQSKFRLVL